MGNLVVTCVFGGASVVGSEDGDVPIKVDVGVRRDLSVCRRT